MVIVMMKIVVMVMHMSYATLNPFHQIRLEMTFKHKQRFAIKDLFLPTLFVQTAVTTKRKKLPPQAFFVIALGS